MMIGFLSTSVPLRQTMSLMYLPYQMNNTLRMDAAMGDHSMDHHETRPVILFLPQVHMDRHPECDRPIVKIPDRAIQEADRWGLVLAVEEAILPEAAMDEAAPMA